MGRRTYIRNIYLHMCIHAIIIRQEREPEFERDHRGALGVLTGKEKVLQLPKIGKKKIGRRGHLSFMHSQ